MTVYKGILFLYSETGTEGGYWALQDEKFMHLPPTSPYWVCDRCGRCWYKDKEPEPPNPSFSYVRPSYMVYYPEEHLTRMEWVADDATELDPDKKVEWHHRSYDEPKTFPLNPTDDYWKLDQKWNESRNATSMECYTNGHGHWKSPEEQYPEGSWSYEGLHVLRNDDKLKIFSKEDPSEVVWEGKIKLKQHELFTESAHGMWIHSEQKGISREEWSKFFFNENPAELTTK